MKVSMLKKKKRKKQKKKEKPKQIQSAKVFHRKTLERQQCHTILPCLWAEKIRSNNPNKYDCTWTSWVLVMATIQN